MVESIAFQGQFFQPLQEITGNKEVAEYRGLIESMEKIISVTGMDLAFAEVQIEKKKLENLEAGKSSDLKVSAVARLTRTAITAYRCAILKVLSGRSFRELSVTIAESLLLQRFCVLDNFN